MIKNKIGMKLFNFERVRVSKITLQPKIFHFYDNGYRISNWAYQWKMNFNADISKQAHEVLFSPKTTITLSVRYRGVKDFLQLCFTIDLFYKFEE